MSGINQHNIPQSLLRGFRVPGGSKKGSKTWLYKRAASPKIAVIKREVGADLHFYSSPSADGKKTLDDLITDYETPFSNGLKILKDTAAGQQVDRQLAAEVVAHLTIRNAHLRKFLSTGTEALFGSVIDLFSDEKAVRPLLGVDETTPSPRIKQFVDEQIAKASAMGPIRIPAEVLYRMAHTVVKERFNKTFVEQTPMLMRALSAFVPTVPNIAREGHNRMLASIGMAPSARGARLADLIWSVVGAPEGGAVLPDCVALADDDGSGLKPLVLADIKRMTAVVMPLSSSKVLVGVIEGGSAPDLAGFNAAAAAGSSEFFIAHREGEDLAALQPLIGTLCDSTLRDAIGQAVEEFRGAKDRTAKVGAAEEPATISDESPTNEVRPDPAFQVSFLGCADETTANEIASFVYAIAYGINSTFSLQRLDGVTFASDYGAAVRDLDRGFESQTEPAPGDDERGGGIGTTLCVVRNGLLKTRIVLCADVAFGLIDEDEKCSRSATRVLVQMLAHAVAIEMFDNALPNVLLKGRERSLKSFLYSHAEWVWSTYFAARVTAALDDDPSADYYESLRSALQSAQTSIPEARLAYRTHGDMDRLLGVALPQIDKIMTCCATVAGHLDGSAQKAVQNDAVVAMLDGLDLGDWFVVFNAELSELWHRQGRWKSFEEFLSLGRHTERLLWQFGLVPWTTEEGNLWVEVPIVSEAERLLASNTQN